MAGLQSRLLQHEEVKEEEASPLVAEEVHVANGNGAAVSSTLGFYEGCPGCAMELRKKEGYLPAKELFLCALLILSATLPVCSLYPFIYFMVGDLGIASSEEKVALYAGILGSALMFGRFMTCAPWGVITDKYGHKPATLVTSISILVFNTTFGFSTSFWMAFMSRLTLGVFNGLLVAMTAYISKLCSQKHQALGMSMVGTTWGVGLIIGPAIGGCLAQPSIQYPELFPAGSLFDRFPYALPCICISAFSVLAWILSFLLPEIQHKHAIPSGTLNNLDVSKTITKERSPATHRGLISAISLYCIWSLNDMAYTELFSLWAESPTRFGGLALTASDVGVILAISGGLLLVFQIFFCPWIIGVLGPINTALIASIVSVPLTAIYPLLARLEGVLLWCVIVPLSVVKNMLSMSIVTSSLILVNNSVSSSERGLASGVSFSLMSLCRALGPFGVGFLLSWAELRMDARFLPGPWMVFSILAVLCVISAAFTCEPIMPRRIEHPTPETLA